MSDLSAKSKQSAIALLLSVTFCDYFGFALIIPLIPLLILNTPFTLLPATIADNSRYLILGSLLSCYPLAQFLGTPILGVISDRFSRKKILLLSFAGNICGYLLCLCAVLFQQVGWLFAGHFLAGLTGMNVPTINAIISDLTKQRKRTRRFSLSYMTLGSAFIIGPYISGRLLCLFASPRASCMSIFAISIALSSFNFLFILKKFKWPEAFSSIDILNLKALYHDILKVLKHKTSLKILLICAFFLFFGWHFFIKFFQVFLIQHLYLDHRQYCFVLTFFGACCLASQAIFYLFIAKAGFELGILRCFTLVLGLAILSFMFLHHYSSALIAVAIYSFAYSLICPSLTYLISTHGTSTNYGRLMGLYQSLQSLAKVLAPSLAGAAMGIFHGAPVIVSFCFMVITCGLFIFLPSSSKDSTQLKS